MSREDAPTRERGRPARMHTRNVTLSFPGMQHPTQLHLSPALEPTKDAAARLIV